MYLLSFLKFCALEERNERLKYSSGSFDVKLRHIRISKGYRVCRFLYKHRLLTDSFFSPYYLIRVRLIALCRLHPAATERLKAEQFLQ